MKILLVKLSALGDVVQTLPSLSYLKYNLPSAEIEWVVDERNAEILEGNPYLNKIWIVSKGFPLTFKKFIDFFKLIRKKSYDLVIDYQGLLKSGIVVGIVKGRFKLGFENHREGSWIFYNKKVPSYDPEMHAVRRYLLLTKFAIEMFQKEVLEDIHDIPDPFLPEKFPEKITLEFPYVVFIPSARWETKIWSFSNWERLAEYFIVFSKSLKVYVIGSGNETNLKVWAEGLERRYPNVKSLVGKLNLKELVYVLRRSLGVISVDTGPMHIASALKVPMVVLFGPTSSLRTGPWGKDYYVIEKKTSCSPCFKKKCRELRCMEEITPEEVWIRFKELLRL